jgi:hypothetical protein
MTKGRQISQEGVAGVLRVAGAKDAKPVNSKNASTET